MKKTINKLFQHLIEQCNADVSAQDELGRTALHIACEYNYIEIIKILGNSQINWDAKNPAGETCLLNACHYGHIDIVKYLIENNLGNKLIVDINGKNALHHAAESGFLSVVEYLVEKCRFDILKKDYNQKTALELACDNSNEDIVEYLSRQPNISKDLAELSLIWSVQHGQLPIVQYLIEKYGFDKEFQNNEGQSLIHIACIHNQNDILSYLIGDNKDYIDKAMGYALSSNHDLANYIWCTYYSKGNSIFQVMKSFIVKGLINHIQYAINVKKIDDNTRDEDENTILHFACQIGNLTVINYLIKTAKFNKECINKQHQTPLHIACKFKQLEVVKYLINKMVSKSPQDNNKDIICLLLNQPNIDEKSLENAFLWSVTNDLSLCKNIISQHQIDLNCRDSNGNSALHLAIKKGSLDTVKFLIEEMNFPREYRNNQGMTALHIACINNNFNIVRYLVLHGNVDINARNYHQERPLDFTTNQQIQHFLKSHGAMSGNQELLLRYF